MLVAQKFRQKVEMMHKLEFLPKNAFIETHFPLVNFGFGFIRSGGVQYVTLEVLCPTAVCVLFGIVLR